MLALIEVEGKIKQIKPNSSSNSIDIVRVNHIYDIKVKNISRGGKINKQTNKTKTNNNKTKIEYYRIIRSSTRTDW